MLAPLVAVSFWRLQKQSSRDIGGSGVSCSDSSHSTGRDDARQNREIARRPRHAVTFAPGVSLEFQLEDPSIIKTTRLLLGLCLGVLVASPARASFDKLLLSQAPGQGFGAVTGNGYAANAARLKQLPFDGLIIRTNHGFAAMNPAYNYNYTDVVSDSNQLSAGLFKNGTLLQNNFMLITVDRPDDAFGSDAKWDVAWAKVRAMTRRAKDLGCVGIWFDDEEYNGKLWNYADSNVCVLRGSKTRNEYRNKLAFRGYQLMASIQQEMPNAIVIAAHGGVESDSTAPADIMDYFDAQQCEDNLRGAFLLGMFRCQLDSGQGTFVDGGEQYRLRNATGNESFGKSFDYRSGPMRFSPYVSGTYSGSYISGNWAKIKIGFGIYDSYDTPFPIEDRFRQTFGTNGTYRYSIERALNAANSYVWCYSEQANWFGATLPGQWNVAVRAARTARGLTNPTP